MRIQLPIVFFMLATLRASAVAPEWQRVDEQREHAFTVEAPRSWEAHTGITRRPGSAMALPWVNTSAPDRQTSVFIGTPALPMFVLPGGFLREEQVVPGV